MKLSKRQFIFGLFAVALFAAILYVVLESPSFMRGRVAGIKVGAGSTDYILIPSSQFTCSENAGLTQTDCSLELEGQTLQTSITHSPGGSMYSCTASYAGETVLCEGQYTILNSPRLAIYVSHNLDISPERMAQIRAQHPLLYWQEDTWKTVLNSLTVAVIVLIVVSLWVFRPQPTARLVRQLAMSGAVVMLGGFLWVTSTLALIFLGYVD